MKKYSLLAVVAVALVAGVIGCSKPEAGGGGGAPASTGTAAPASTST